MFENANVFDTAASQVEEKETTPSESAPEKVETPSGQDGSKETPKDLKPGEALHKDARFRRVIEDRNRLRTERDEMLQRIQALESKKETVQTSKNESIPAWFAKYFGTEGEAQEAWQNLKPLDRDGLKAELRDELRKERESESKENSRWDSWVNEQVDGLEEEGESFERNALLKVMDQFRPTDDEGNLDFRKGLELLKLKGSPADQTEAKRKAGALVTTAKTGSEPAKKNYVTPSDIRKWKQNGTL